MEIILNNKVQSANFPELFDEIKKPGYIDYADSEGNLQRNAQVSSIMVTSENDLENLPNDYLPGSIAYTPGFKLMWQLAADGTTWVSLLD